MWLGTTARRWAATAAGVAVPLAGMLSPVLTPAQAVVPGAAGKVVFTSCRTGASEIWVMNADGTGQAQLTRDGAKQGGKCADSGSREPVWSPDGTKIAFTSYMNGTVGSSSDIFVMNPDGTGRVNLTKFSGFDDEPAWSPDGTKIAWRSNRGNSNDAEVWVMNADGSSPVQVTHHGGVDDEPAWSPDGTKIAIRRCNPNSGANAGHCSLALINPDGTNVTDIGEVTPGGKDDPAWSPDGKLIAFRSYGVNGEPDIHVVNAADGTNKVDLTNDADSNVDPAYSPDETKIAYVRQPVNIPERSGNGEIWLMNADGSGQVNLTNDPGFDGDADFQIVSTATPPTTAAPGPTPTTAPTTATPPASEPATPARSPAAPSPDPARSGYRMVDTGGKVYAFGQAQNLGNASVPANIPAVDLEQDPVGDGYWVVDCHGVVYPFGSARSVGNAGGKLQPEEKVTSLSATSSGGGYWIFTDRGRALSFGDAAFHGDMGGVKLNGPVLDSVPTPSGLGYYMVASDGGVFTFGDAHFAGSTGSMKLNAPVQSLVPDRDGAGYWLVASDGGVFSFGSQFRGSMGAVRLNKPMTGMIAFGNGYLMVAEDGGIFNFSDRPFDGSLGATPPAQPVVSVAAAV
jgi:Tol biopolymer transport system component